MKLYLVLIFSLLLVISASKVDQTIAESSEQPREFAVDAIAALIRLSCFIFGTVGLLMIITCCCY